MSLIRFGEGGSHFYAKDGSPRHGATLREARKEVLYASVTSIDKATFVNAFLDKWRMNELVAACLENPRQPHESPEDYATRVYELSLMKSVTASEFGHKIHSAVEEYPNPAKDPSLQPWVDKFGDWYNDNIKETIKTEATLIDHEIGVAGRTDLIAIHKTLGLVIVDHKTQGIKPDKKGRKAPNYYPSWTRQLGFYSAAYAKEKGLWPNLPTCISLVIDSTEATPFYQKVWGKDEINAAYKTFVVAAWQFYDQRDFWPAQKWELNPSVRMP